MLRCARCSANVTAGSKFCVACGARLEGSSLGAVTESDAGLPNPFARTALAADAAATTDAKVSRPPRVDATADEMSATIPIAIDMLPVPSPSAAPVAGKDGRVISPRAHTGPSPAKANSTAPEPASAPPAIVVGARVVVRWSDGKDYAGVVQQSFGTQCAVAFADGRQLWIETNLLALAP